MDRVFRTRRPLAVDACAKVVPPLEAVGAGHRSACLRNHEIETAEARRA